MSEHSAKRQRLTGSFSPASPPYHLSAKPLDQQTKPVVQPNTPTSPPYPPPMNPRNNGAPPSAPIVPAPEMTPPSSVSMSQHTSQPAGPPSHASLLATPKSLAGTFSSSHVDSDGDTAMESSEFEGAAANDEHRRSDHERQRRAVSGGPAAGSQLFSLCQSSHPVGRPHSSANLFELYGLSDLAQSVARTDPKTGEKINKMRKSYENHIKSLQIAGKPKAVKMENVFTQLTELPEEIWQAHKVSGKEFENALDPRRKEITPGFDALLGAALGGMGPGTLPTSDGARYKAYIGTDDAAKPKPVADGPGHRGTPAPSTSAPYNTGVPSRASRPERSNAKRSYTDGSFQGYGEGFTDDGYGDSGADDGHGGVKRRKLGFSERAPHSVEVGGPRR